MVIERSTRQRDDRSVIASAKRPLSPREILESARDTVPGLASHGPAQLKLLAEGVVEAAGLG
jgi:hypothetical protein